MKKILPLISFILYFAVAAAQTDDFKPVEGYLMNVSSETYLGADDNNITVTTAEDATKNRFYMRDSSLYLRVSIDGTSTNSNTDLHNGSRGFSLGTASPLKIFEVDPDVFGYMELTPAKQPEAGKTYVIIAPAYGGNGYQAMSNAQANLGSIVQRLRARDVSFSNGVLGIASDKSLYWTFTDSVMHDTTDPDAPSGEFTNYTDNLRCNFIMDGGTPGHTTPDVTAKVYDNDNGQYDIVFDKLYLTSGDGSVQEIEWSQNVGRLTISGVSGTTNADGLTLYSFAGDAKISNIQTGFDVEAFELGSAGGQNDKIHITNFVGQSKDGKLYLSFDMSYDYTYMSWDGSFGTASMSFNIVYGTMIDAAGIAGVKDNHDGRATVYSLGGVKLDRPQRGLNIIRTADGRTIKVIK